VTPCAGGVALPVTDVSARSPRLMEVTAPADDAGLRALWRAGRPVQYAHLHRALAPWDVATTYGGRPWAVEMPSAGRPLSWDVLARLALRGVRVESLTHAAGLSSTGDPAIDAVLPFPERYEIPARTIDAVTAARAAGHRVVAVGTTVVRALESWARSGARAAVTDLLLDEHHALRAVDAIVSGIHDPSDSHFRLLEAFAPRSLLLRAHDHARAALYRGHELGDLLLILPDSRSR
jgi:S-adenosylmethionine:tRNA ribosyltransferase-isomerase